MRQDAIIAWIFKTGLSNQDPRTALIKMVAGDPVHLHVVGAFGQHPHIFLIDNHRVPFEVNRPDAMHLYPGQFGAGDTMGVVLEGGAGGVLALPGDYLYRDGRNPFLEGGIGNVMRDALVAPLFRYESRH